MNYYEKMLEKISNLIKTSPEEALALIEDELKAPYVPHDVLEKLKEFKSQISINNSKDFNLSIVTIIEYLHSDESKQCIAVEELSKLNLRDHENTISDFLLSKGSLVAKVKLMIALHDQESNQTFSIIKDNKIFQFVPKDIILPDSSDYYLEATKVLNDYYLKNPDMLQLAKELLYNDYILNLPEGRVLKDVKYVTSKVIRYIDDSFDK